MMKLYSYSSELLTFVEVKWVNTKFVIAGILLGIVILLGLINLNQSVGNALESRSASTLAAENKFLKQQVSLISPRVSKMEIKVMQLNKRANKLHLLLRSGKIELDTVLSFTDATKELKQQAWILAAKSLHH